MAAADKKDQIIVEAQAFDEGQEHHPYIKAYYLILDRYRLDEAASRQSAGQGDLWSP